MASFIATGGSRSRTFRNCGVSGVQSALVSLAEIEAAAARISAHVVRTPTVVAPGLSAVTSAEITLKLENLQITGSFKPRGAINTISQLSPIEQTQGVAAVSAGNHAQGLAFAGRVLGVAATVLMPASAPEIKRRRTLELGAEVIVAGDTFDDAAAALPAFIAQSGATLVHPFDDRRVIAGQGTVALELLADAPDLEVLIVAIGGGGLISGVAAAKAVRPQIEVIGVQSERYAAMAKATGRWSEPVIGGPTIAEGMAAKVVSALTEAHVRALVEDIIVVDEEQIGAAMASMVDDARVVAEGAGAAPLAAVNAHRDRFAGRKLGLVVCGGNVDPNRLAGVLRG